MHNLSIAVMTVSLCLASFALAADPVVLAPAEAMATAPVTGPNVSREVVRITGQKEFTEAVEISTSQPHDFAYGVQVAANSVAPVRKGDVCLATVWARTTEAQGETSEGRMLVYYQKAGRNWNKHLMQTVSVPKAWTKFQIPFRVNADYAAGKSAFCLGFGHAAQSVQFANASVVNYGQNYDMGKLPRTKVSYPGRELDAPWRAAAAQRIEKHRKGDLAIEVLDSAGKPVPAADVKVEMTKHAYWFGAAVYAPRWSRKDADAKRYREEILKNFNAVVVENSLKWEAVAGDWGAGRAEMAVEFYKWAKEHGLHTRAHCLVWPGRRFLPKAVLPLLDKAHANELRKTIDRHVRDTATLVKGLVDEWDVVNELWGNQDVTNILGLAEVGKWFRMAHEIDPDCQLYMNDYGIVSGYTRPDGAHIAFYIKMAKDLLANGDPIDGLGCQCHFGSSPTSPLTILAALDELEKIGLPVQATEFDMGNPDEQLQADFTRDFMTAFFSHPVTVGIINWGFWEKQHHYPQAALIRKDWSYRPSMKVWRDLIYNQWWTRESGKTAENGKLTVRGFLGEYKITVAAGGKTKTVETTLSKKGQTVQVKMD